MLIPKCVELKRYRRYRTPDRCKTGNQPKGKAAITPVNSFHPLAGPKSRILVLGTMPGRASIEHSEYYAHPQNAFWPIALAHLSKASVNRTRFSESTYKSRTDQLINSHIGLWDVLAQCRRAGSLDSNIEKQSEVPNPINELLKTYITIEAIIFNGKTAEKLFKRHIDLDKPIPTYSLPSTSPAMASLSLEDKFVRWNQVLNQYQSS